MNRSKKIYVLLGILLAVCAITFGVSKYEEKKEQIKNSDEIIMELAGEDVTSISWEYEDVSLAFHRDEIWLYDEDKAFPVSEEKMDELLGLFEAFGVSFIIEDVEDFGQYGLDDPICTIRIGTEEETYEISLGDYSKMDEERYVSIGDGNVYLVQNDPMESFEIELKDMIRNDEIPDFEKVTELTFSGSESYTAVYSEENSVTYSEDDVYFVKENGKTIPLDTSNVKGYVNTVEGLGFEEYVSYNATEEEIEACGLDDPELSVTMEYTVTDEENDEEQTGTFVLHISRDPKEQEEETVTAYARVGESQILYKLTKEEYESLMEASLQDLRHQKLFWADFSDVYQAEITLDDRDYTLTSEEDDDETIWYYQEEELEIDEFQRAVTSLTASEFTEEKPSDREEIRVKLYLNNENVPEVEIVCYRYDGSSCLAVVDGEPTARIDRSTVVDLIEAVHAIVLNQTE